MGNRILKEDIRTSKTVNAMNDFQFRCWAYLITYVDDYGRGSADAEILRGFVFPRLKRLRESDIERTLAELADLGAIHLYNVDGEPFFCLPNWGTHQRIQTKKSKFPAPPTDIHGNPPWVTVSHGESRLVTVGHGDPPPETNTIQSELESENESEFELESETNARAQNAARFEEFWTAYPKKVEKKKALAVWEKLKPDDVLFEQIMAGLNKAKNSKNWTKDEGQFIPHPTTWLNGARWNDELEVNADANNDPWATEKRSI